MFILMNLKIEAKRTRSKVRKFISKRSEHVYIKETKRSNLVLNCESSEAKRTYLLPKIKLAKRSEHVYNKKLKNRSEAMVVNIKL